MNYNYFIRVCLACPETVESCNVKELIMLNKVKMYKYSHNKIEK
jgi:hypothetical protein